MGSQPDGGAGLFVRLLGPPAIEGPTGALHGSVAQRHRLALLGILASSDHHRLSREKLICLLWPDADIAHGRQLLNSSVYAIRSALGQSTVWTDRSTLGLNPDLIRVDSIQFQNLLEDGRVEDAVALYAGPFMDGLSVPGSAEFDHWLDAQRDELERMYRGALETLARRCVETGAVAVATQWWRKRLERSPWEGAVALELMKVLELSGQRVEALRVAAVHARLLRDDLGTEPDPAIHALEQRLRLSPPPVGALEVRSSRGSHDAPAPTPLQVANRRRSSKRNARARGTMWGATAAAVLVLIASSARMISIELARIDEKGTEAYRSYIDGLAHERSGVTAASVRSASASFTRAVTLDDDLGEAWAGLSRMHLRSYTYALDQEQDHLALGIAAAERAVAARPDLPEARLAMAAAQYHAGDLDRALRYAEPLVTEGTSLAEAYQYAANIYRRRGRWQEAAALYGRAANLTPLDPRNYLDLGTAEQVLHHFPEALAAYERAVSVAPSFTPAYAAMIRLHLAWRGDVAAARAVAERIPAQQSLMRQTHLAYLDAVEGRYRAGLTRLAPYTDTPKYEADLTQGFLYARVGRPDSARARLYSLAKQVTRIDSIQAARGNASGMYVAVQALAYALVGNKSEAFNASYLAGERTPLSSDAAIAPEILYQQARIYAAFGMNNFAVATLRQLGGIPSLITPNYIRLDPFLASLRDEPGLTDGFPEASAKP